MQAVPLSLMKLSNLAVLTVLALIHLILAAVAVPPAAAQNDVTQPSPLRPTAPYRVESKDRLAPGPWTLVPGTTIRGNGAVVTVQDPRPRSPTNRFYRAVMTP